jgi:phosphoribosyl-ATP pyrophosphohydrolase/phosphoribosyl-AMP cyclohydrolase
MTDRRILDAEGLDEISFDERGLVPVVAQDSSSGRVLMVAWANRAALAATLGSGELHFHSRSRDRLWRKGETSGNTLRVGSLHADCDGDTVLALVEPTGPACHTGDATCFGGVEGATLATSVLHRLEATLADRAARRPEGSYTVRLLDEENLRLKKLGEEAAELVAGLAKGDSVRAGEEAADLLYHVIVALHAVGISVDDVLDVLDERSR